jgi:glycosyltransferase involved in cell wall biosynthesis
MKIGFAGRWNPLDKKSWSGTCYYTYRQIQQHHQVEPFQFQWPFYMREWLILKKQYGKLLLKKNVAVEFLTGYAQYFSRALDKAVKGKGLDALFVPAAPQLIAFAKTDIPIIFLTDASFQQIQGYYQSFQNMAGFSLRQGVDLDRRAFRKAAHCLLASGWCRQSAIADYGVPPENITVAPLGANLDIIPGREDIYLSAKDDVCDLLFIGVEWERKGGQIALDAFAALQKMGINSRLTIIGCVPPFTISDPNITVIAFLDKHDAQQSQQLYTHLKNADFLLLPTRAEAAGLVFSEASAYGVPSISTHTGGVPTYVQEGVNGYTLPLTETGGAYAQKIASLFTDKAHYEALRHSSRQRFETELNWGAWGDAFNGVLKKVTG